MGWEIHQGAGSTNIPSLRDLQSARSGLARRRGNVNTKELSMQHYIDSLKKIFAGAPNKHEANYRSRAVLEDMSADPSFFRSALE